MDDGDLLQQALEKLEFFAHMKGVSEDTARLIAALRERLAQPEQEIDWKDQYEKQKRRAEMWRDKYEAIAGPDECVYPAQPEQESFSREAISATQAAWKMGYDAAKAEQPEQEPVACQYAKDVAMPEHRCAAKCQYAQPEQEQWDAIPDAFNEWWDADYDDTGNPYRKDSPAYWAWSGWKAASKQPAQEPVAWMYHGIRHDDTPHERPSLIWKPEYMDVMSAEKGAKATPLYTTPPQRKPLKLREIEKCIYDANNDPIVACRNVEAAHGIGEQP